MFASSNRFGQPSNSSPFGTQTQSMFCQTNNPFAPKPSGTSTPFGAQTGGSMFGASQAFGSSTPSFGASPAPDFGTTTSPFGGSFGSSTPQSSLFGSTTQQSQPPFGNSSFGSSTPFGASSTPAFGASSTPALSASNTFQFGSSTPFGASSTPSSGASSTPALSASNTFQFGSSSTHAFGASSTPFGASSSPAFGASPAQAFCSSGAVFSNNAFGCGGGVGGSSTSTFGASSTPAFGASKTPAFGVSSTPSFSFGSSPGFGQSTSAFGSGSSGSTQSPFGAQGAQASTPTFGGQSTSGVQQGGSRVMPYTPTTEADSGTGKLQSISAMSVYKEKNHGELRWEDYQRGDKGGKLPVGQSPGGTGYGVPNPQPSIFSPSPTFSQTTANPANPFSSSIATKSLAQKTSTTFPSFSSSFDQNTTPSIVWSTISSNTTSGFGPSPGFATTKSQPFSSTPAFSTGGNFNSSYSSPLFSSYSSSGPNTTPVFGPTSSAVAQTSGVQQGGSRVMPYAPTTEADSDTGKLLSGKLQSISAMSVYKEKNHGELRWEDYQRGDKGGKLPVGRSPGGAGSGITNPQPSIFSPSPTFSRTTANPANLFSSSIATNSFAQKASTTFPSFSSSFDQNTTPSIVWSTTSSNSTSGVGSSPGFATTKSQPFALAPSHGSTPAFSTGGNFNNSYSSPLFSSYSSFGQNTTSVFGPTSSAVAQTNNLITPSTGYGNLSSSSSSLTTNISPYGQTTPAGLTLYPSVQPSKQPSDAFDFNNSGQTGNTTGVTGGTGSLGLGNFGSVSVSSVAMLPPLTNPFGTLPASPQISISQGGNLPSNQYGISSMPVVDKPVPVRRSPLLTSRNLLHRRDRLPTRKYRPDDDGPKVPFFSNLEENSRTPKASVLFSPRENPRALFINPMERLRSEDPKDGLTSLHENGKPDKNNAETRESPLVKPSQKPNGTHENHEGGTNGSHSTSPSGVDTESLMPKLHHPENFREPRIQEQVTKEVDVESLMPKLHHPEYFTEPRIQELATKEKVDPGYCKRVKDFVVGRHGYGSIKFLGETDVSRLDLEMSVRFANREVNVYMDESKKPPVGQGLNKPALVTLMNIKCMDKKSGRQVKEGERLDKYKERLKKKAEEQGAKFVFYDAVNGVWTFKVEHF